MDGWHFMDSMVLGRMGDALGGNTAFRPVYTDVDVYTSSYQSLCRVTLLSPKLAGILIAHKFPTRWVPGKTSHHRLNRSLWRNLS